MPDAVVPFGAGLLSFVHPCVWPLVPGYLSFLAGTVPDTPDGTTRARASHQAGWFVVGCTLVLMALGAGAALLGTSLKAHQILIERAGGVLLILFGIAFAGRVRLPWLSGDHRLALLSGPPAWWRSILVGSGFALSWSACVGPILASVVALTVLRSERIVDGVLSMLLFGLGQGVPFVAMAFLAERMRPWLRRYRRYATITSTLGAVSLVVLGALLLSGQFSELD